MRSNPPNQSQPHWWPPDLPVLVWSIAGNFFVVIIVALVQFIASHINGYGHRIWILTLIAVNVVITLILAIVIGVTRFYKLRNVTHKSLWDWLRRHTHVATPSVAANAGAYVLGVQLVVAVMTIAITLHGAFVLGPGAPGPALKVAITTVTASPTMVPTRAARLSAGVSTTITAQGLPTASPTITIPSADECGLKPRPSLIETGLSSSTPTTNPTDFTRSVNAQSTPAPWESGQIELAMRLFADCVNAADPDRFLALYSDDGLSRVVFPSGFPKGQQGEDALQALQNKLKSFKGEFAQPGIEDVRRTADGRLIATVIGVDPLNPGAGVQRQRIIFVRNGAHWLIDDEHPA